MTTRAGLTGMVSGLLATLIVYPFFIANPEAFLNGTEVSFLWLPGCLLVLLVLGCGFTAARRSRSTQPWRCAALGALAGGLAGCILFCLWGAAAAGSARWVSPSGEAATSQIDVISGIIRQTLGMFLLLFLSGCLPGALGGWLSRLGKPAHPDVFDKTDPQMAMNAAITAVPASYVAAALALWIFSRLSGILGISSVQTELTRTIVEWPLLVSLLLVVISHLALTLVVPHEAQQAEHRCGTDEVKMAAFVSIATAPVLIFTLLLVDGACLKNLLVDAALLACIYMSLVSVRSLVKRVLPKRASFAVPQDERQKTEAVLFGSIAKSYGPRLVILCTGCGLMMVLPLYVSVISVLINLKFVQVDSAFLQQVPWGLFTTQALVSMGIIVAAVVALSLIYLFYLNLGRWFSKRNSLQSDKS